MWTTCGPFPDPNPTATLPPCPTGISSNGLIVEYMSADTNYTDPQIRPNIRLINFSDNNFTYEEITLRYYYTKEGTAEEEGAIDFSMPGNPWPNILPDVPFPWRK